MALETSRGLLAAVLPTGKRARVFAINPMVAARDPDRHPVSRKKSDRGNSLVLANILRTDMHAHRPLPQDNDLSVPSPSWPAPSRTPPGTGSSTPTSSGLCYVSTTRKPWTPSPTGRTAAAVPRQANYSDSPPRPPRAERLSRTQSQAALKRAGRYPQDLSALGEPTSRRRSGTC
ncbi:hypothetical protein GCM10022207_86530 [Streptomyces lannensis]|uniref:Transposase IS111A/IS1328/IS1533 N-terminal domain-containing protein n=1 Tax=Streptomyces lannensis TaxID=766498 RepID=A0ABP7LRM9_9ACTN